MEALGYLGEALGILAQPVNLLAMIIANFFGLMVGMLPGLTSTMAVALLTGLSLFDDIAKRAGAGTLVPITGFANAIAAPAVEFQTEGLILGVGAKMFTIAGPVIVYGVSASVVYGLIYWLALVR